MIRLISRACFLPLIFVSFVAPRQLIAARGPSQQGASGVLEEHPFDPMKYLTESFPDSVTLKQKGHLLEFCPDNTCNGFSSALSVSAVTLKDFAYLYIYYFSEYIYLSDWRSHTEAKEAAQRVLSEPKYRDCKAKNQHETAKCVLLDLSRHGEIKLMFIRYDENRRSVVPEDIPEELARKPSSE